jgi:hypothetical protein
MTDLPPHHLNPDEYSGMAVIENGCLVIRLHLSFLPSIVEGAWAAGGMETRYKVTDSRAFAADLVTELNREEEDGTTRVHRMFDGAIDEAINQGAEGIEEHEDQEV